jgi:uncharacterized protein (DUF362 family)
MKRKCANEYTSWLSRREFLRVSGTTVLGTASGLWPWFARGVPELAAAEAAQPSVVGIAKGNNLNDLTREALALVGGISKVVRPGAKVFIKPNLAAVGNEPLPYNAITWGVSTKPEIVATVAEECLLAGAEQIIIGEAGQTAIINYGSKTVYEVENAVGAVSLDGASDLEKEVHRLNRRFGRQRVVLKSLNVETPYWGLFPTITDLRWLAVSSHVMEADVVISVPVLKTHHLAATTLSIKNLYGVTPVSLYGSPRLKGHEADLGIEQVIIDLFKAIKPHLAVIDGSVGAEGEAPNVGPEEGRTVDVHQRIGGYVVMASTDFLAADATASRIIGLEPEAIRYIWMGAQQGLGQMDKKNIETRGATMSEVQMKWAPSLTSGYPQRAPRVKETL